MLRYCVGVFSAVMIAGAAHAEALSPVDISNRHVAALAKSDMDAVMADYADDAIFMQDGKAIQGKAAIRAMFEKMMPPRPAGSPPPAPSAFKVTRVWQEGDIGFLGWEAGAAKGVDEFLVRDGKIQVQAVFMGSTPPTSPQ